MEVTQRHQEFPADRDREGNDIRAEDMILINEEPGEIEKFYDGATVFITGASGFVGKILIEKLLRTCSGIKKIYLLLRAKKGKEPQDRFQALFSDIVFNRLRNERPDFERKLHMVMGDMQEGRLGITEEDYSVLAGEVDVVLHAAATVRFDEKLRIAADINVRGTKEILILAKSMKNLKAFVHVSTAYSNCIRKEVDERIYDPPISPEKLLAIVDTLDDPQLLAITPLLLGDFPNTYVYTKAIAENLLKSYGKGLPVSILRPSIVIATAKEPIAGWIDNFYGATGVALGAAIGLLRTLHCDPNKIADLVPVDLLANAILATAWNTAGENLHNAECNEKTNTEIVKVYNYVGSVQAPLSWRDYMKLTEAHALKIPSPLVVWHYCLQLNPNYYVHMLAVYLLHFLPAICVDAGMIVMGKKPMLLKGYKKINKFAEVISYFSSREWKFKNNNVQHLWSKLGRRDQHLFDFNMSTLKWDEYFYTYVRGMRVYLLKDPLDTIPEGRLKYMKLKFAHYFLVSLLLLGLLKLLYTMFMAVVG